MKENLGKNIIKVAVVGAAGYTGIEVVRWLLEHPSFKLVLVTSDGDAGKRLDNLYPALLGATDLVFQPHEALLARGRAMRGSAAEPGDATEIELAFLAVPHTAAMDMVPTLLARGISVIDLSADFRLKDPAVYAHWYGVTHRAPELLAQAVYGLVEARREELKAAGEVRAKGTPVLVSNPGCYPTASLLTVLPALRAGLAGPGAIVINAISGVSGAGRKPAPATHFCSASDDLAAYGATTHRHTPEIAQALEAAAGRRLPLVFTPHLAPLIRGMVATAVIPLEDGVDEQDCLSAYQAAYAREPFVCLLKPGAMPHCKAVVGTNNAHVGIAFDQSSQSLVASCVIDNLGKGAASQAVQCANLLFGLTEDSGLGGLGPII